jgi:PAS domain S-box-containing protein
MTIETGEQPHAGRRTVTRLLFDRFRLAHLRTSSTIAMALLLLVGSLWLASANLNAVRKADAHTEQAYSLRVLSETLLSTLTEAETGQRGYLLTGNAVYLAPYTAARARLSAEFAQLWALPQMQGDAARRLEAAQTLARAKMAEIEQTIALAQAGHRRDALKLVKTGEGRRIMDALRVQLAGLKPEGDAELQSQRARATSAWPRAGVVALGVMSSALLIGWGLGQRRARRVIGASLTSLKRFTSAFGLSQGLLRTLNGTITFWAGGMQRLYGYTEREALGRRTDDLLRTQFSTPQHQIQEALESDGHWEGDVVNRHRDGSALEVATQLTLHQGPVGEADTVIELDNDISETRRAQRADERSSALLRTIVETAPGRIYAKDLDGRMLLANGGALELIGKPWSEVEGRTDLELMASSAQAEIVMANDRRIMAAGRVEEMEELNGAEAQVWLSIKSPLRDAAGQVSGLVGVSVDITEFKRRATQLATLNAELSDALAASTAALQQRDVLLREVYHRVKNNLQIIDGLVVMQARRMEDPGARAALMGLRNRLHALALVHHQLMHSKNLRTFDIAPFLKELAGNLLEGGGEAGVHLSVRAIPLEVDLDFAIPLGLLVAELVTNSLKHAFPDGKGTITVSLERTADGGIALVVADDGQGRSPGDAASGPGKAGLGTSIINGLIEQLQGELIMGNERGVRTEIRVAAPGQS